MTELGSVAWIKETVEQADAGYEFHYLDSSNSICKAQLMERTVKEPERHATDTPEMFDAVTRHLNHHPVMKDLIF